MTKSYGYDGESMGFIEYDKSNNLFHFTTDGVEQFKNLIAIGCPIEEVADFLGCDPAQLKAAILPGGQLHTVHRHATAINRIAVRQAQQDLSKRFPTMAKHLGHHTLGQPVAPAPSDPGLEEKVIGAMPDWEMSPEDWLEQYKGVQDNTESTIEKLKKMRIDQESETEDGV